MNLIYTIEKASMFSTVLTTIKVGMEHTMVSDVRKPVMFG